MPVRVPAACARYRREHPTLIRRALAAAAMVVALGWFFRDAIVAGGGRLYGDGYDALIEAAILEHWFAVVRHGAAWDRTFWFWPHPATLGYNDTYLIAALGSVPARLAGADPLLAATASHVWMRAIAFVGSYGLLRRGLGVRTWLALAGAGTVTTANVSLMHLYHGQLLSVGLLPWLGWGVLATIRAIGRGDTRATLLRGIATAIVFAATALNAFYAAFFFALFIAVALPLAALQKHLAGARIDAEAIRRMMPTLVAAALAGIIALYPFAHLYLPKAAAGAGHPWAPIAGGYLLDPAKLLNVGPGNLLWGTIAKPLPGGEARVGIPPGLLVLSLIAFGWALRGRERTIPFAIGGAALVLVLLAWRMPNGASAWWYVWQWVPGARAVRTVSRVLLFLLPSLMVLVVLWLDRARIEAPLRMMLVLLLLLEQVSTDAPLGLDRRATLAMLRTVGTPPAACDSFAVVRARPGDPESEARRIDRAWGGAGNALPNAVRYPHNVDAMLIAATTRRPTINGYSSVNPPDWDFARPDAPDYLARVRRYAARHGLRPCMLDTRRMPIWSTVTP